MSDSFRTEVEVEIDGQEIYEWVLENCRDELKEELRDEILEEADEVEMDTLDLENRLHKIAKQMEGDEIATRALQTAIGIIQIERQGQRQKEQEERLRKLEAERQQLQKEINAFKTEKLILEAAKADEVLSSEEKDKEVA